MSFVLNKESSIAIYGASAGSIKWCAKAQNQGFLIEAFLDKNAENIKQVNHIPVYTIDAWQPDKSKNVIVIVMLQNAMQHYQIMMQLYSKGIQKVLCFPVESYGLQKEKLRLLRFKYNECIQFLFKGVLEGIPEYADIFQTSVEEWKKIIREDGSDIIFYVPFELCYTEEKKTNSFWQSDYTRKARDLSCRYIFGKNICQLRPYWEMYDYLDGKREDCRLYLDIFGKAGHESHDNYSDLLLLKDRNSLYQLYYWELERGNTFFEESAATGRVTQDGKIRIIDGVHRSVFLIRAGYKNIPIRLSKSELKYMGNIESLQIPEKNMAEKNNFRLKHPVEHPDFYNFVFEEEYIRELWIKISNVILGKKISYQTIVDLSLTGGYFVRNFLRMGSKRGYCYSEQNDYEELTGQLFRMDSIQYICDMNCLNLLIKDEELVVVKHEVWNKKQKFFDDILKETNAHVCIINVDLPDGYRLKRKMGKECIWVDKYVVGGRLLCAILKSYHKKR